MSVEHDIATVEAWLKAGLPADYGRFLQSHEESVVGEQVLLYGLSSLVERNKPTRRSGIARAISRSGTTEVEEQSSFLSPALCATSISSATATWILGDSGFFRYLSPSGWTMVARHPSDRALGLSSFRPSARGVRPHCFFAIRRQERLSC